MSRPGHGPKTGQRRPAKRMEITMAKEQRATKEKRKPKKPAADKAKPAGKK